MTAVPLYVNAQLAPWESYGLIGLKLCRHLREMGVEVDLHGPGAQGATKATGGILLGVVDGFPERTSRAWQGPRVAITMFESTRLPAAWVAPLNDCDAVIVPSHFCAEVFAQSGVMSPLHVVPLGLGDVYQYCERPKTPQPLTFLAFMDRGERKGGQMALQAFLRAFGEDENYRLILKSRAAPFATTFANTNIETIQANFSEAELYALYCRADVLVNPHRAEGWGLIPREFAASGGLALTTAWSGTADDLEQWGMGIPYKLVRSTWRDVPKHAGQELGEWAEVDVKVLAELLRMVAADWHCYHRLLRRTSENAHRLYRWSTFAARVLAIWEGVFSGNSTRLPVA